MSDGHSKWRCQVGRGLFKSGVQRSGLEIRHLRVIWVLMIFNQWERKGHTGEKYRWRRELRMDASNTLEAGSIRNYWNLCASQLESLCTATKDPALTQWRSCVSKLRLMQLTRYIKNFKRKLESVTNCLLPQKIQYTCECDFTWKYSLCRCNQDDMQRLHFQIRSHSHILRVRMSEYSRSPWHFICRGYTPRPSVDAWSHG